MAGFRIFRRLLDLLDVNAADIADGETLVWDADNSEFIPGSGGGGGGAPTDATYITQTANSTLSAEQALSSLSTGIVKVTTGTGVLSTATANTDYAAASHASRHQNGGADEISIAGLDGTPTELQNHIDDTSAAHAASAISILDTANDFTATDVEGALAELQSDAETDAQNLADHLADSSAAHAASAISADSTTLVGTGTDVQAVLEELDNGIADHLADSSAAHAASAISFSPTGNLSSTDAQAAIAEAATDAASALSTHESDTTSVHGITDTSSLYRSGGTDVALADGGTGASLTDPNADRIMFWDDSAGQVTWLTAGTGLTITNTTIDASSSGGMTVVHDSTLGADAADFDVTSISGSYKALKWCLTGRGAASATEVEVRLRMNNDSGTNYEYQRPFAHSGNNFSGSDGNGTTYIYIGEIAANSATSGRVGAIHGMIHDYAGTTFNKLCHVQGGRVASLHLWEDIVGSWRSTSAITRLTFFPSSGNFLAGTRLTIWGFA